ncbi:importin [Grosmannia clavigera kw1407]|uniref:Importin n=1 Tax=Grosmannia clavigera (strain kw1407 / UAMH 11150) TaxID=655863 RepID=F0XCI2_GROCL|nr:importin [Grosmannia clavigera kw1407]EFX03642.1 importin [Grosmannia clavigera kw1407]
MSFAIEVPGEAVPFNIPDLCKALQAGTSSDHNQRQSATQQLDEWKTHPGFYSALQSVYLEYSLPSSVRLLAIIMLKNGIDRDWRGAANARGGIQPDEKARIRARLFEGTIREEDRTLARQSAVLTAKVVRIDYPQEWPTALPEIVSILRSVKDSSHVQLHGTVLLLLRVIKELSTARLRRSALQQMAEEILYLLIEVYRATTDIWVDCLVRENYSAVAVDYAVENSLHALKAIRHLVVNGFDNPAHSPLVQQFWGLSHSNFESFISYIHPETDTPPPHQEVIGRHILQLAKLHIAVCDAHPASFALLPNSVVLVHVYWDLVSSFANMYTSSAGLRPGGGSARMAKPKVEGPFFEQLALKGLLLLKSCHQIISRPMVAFKNRDEQTRREQAQGKQIIETQLFTSEFMLVVVDVIVSKLFVFRQSDLAAWDEDPEEWEAEESESGSAWEWQVRPCAEKLFLGLLIKNKSMLVQPLLAYFDRTMNGSMDLLTKEAVYTAMGNAAVAIEGMFDFDSFVASTLVQDAQSQFELARVLRRRVAMLLSAWAFHELKPDATRAVYSISAHLLNASDPANDLVVRLTAARQIKATANIAFSAEAFDPFSTGIFSSLMQLLQEVENEETKLAVLDTIRVLIERMETTAARFSDSVVAALPAVWESAGPETYMIKQSVLAIISSLVMALQAASQRYHELILPLIADAVNPSSSVHEHLLDEGLDLWCSVMTMSSSPLSENLVGLLLRVVPLLEYDSPVVETCLRITNAYIVLEPSTALSEQFRKPVLNGLACAMETTRTEQVQEAAAVMRHLVQEAQVLGGSEGVSLIVQDLRETGFLERMLKRIHGAWEAHQSTGPKAKQSPIGPTTEIQYYSILGWVALADPRVFVQSILCSTNDAASVWSWLGAEWFGIFEMMGSSEHLKLSCLGLTRLCELAEPMQGLVLGRLQDYFSMWTSTVADAQGDATQPDCYVWDGPPTTEYDTPLQTAENALAAKEPVHTERTFDFVLLRLQSLVAQCGGEQQFEAEWAVNVDVDVLAGFRELSQPRKE